MARPAVPLTVETMRYRYLSRERSWAMLQDEFADDLRREIRSRGDVPPHRDGEPDTISERYAGGYRMHCSCGAVGEVVDRARADRAARDHHDTCEARRSFVAARRERRRRQRAARDAASRAATEDYAKREQVCIGGVTRDRVNGVAVYSWYCLCGRDVGTSHGTRLAAQQARADHVARFAAKPR